MLPPFRSLCVAAWAFCSAGSQAQTLPYRFDPAHTQVHWEVRHFGTSTSRGRFTDVQGQVLLDRATRQGEVSVILGTASVDTGVPPLDATLRGEHFFASKDHPHAYFVSRQLTFDGDRLTRVAGELTLRGVSVSLVLVGTRFDCHVHPPSGKTVCGGDFEGELTRSDLGITYGLPFVGDRVRLVVQVEAIAP